MSASTALAAAAVFNLLCTGQEMSTIGNSDHESERFSVVYRVNLTEKRYCSDDCRETLQLYSVSPTEILFNYIKRPNGYQISTSVKRESGAYAYIFDTPDGYHMKTGVCKRAPFTGFAKPKF
ncbi:hypothetical protein SAMN05428974_0600 [Sphingopyxis sp. YR583]|uniref:hypothetical protein n=1 Tax=Sphingopyxis sp. YR583 TaxID=1881047 RepID=UPI0008A7A99F|nr:hypothetical protein [Sphingopyxis sp. YR583]SEH12926.1 hypothetical protein SAMN05428974_0600 [Sphingopyxis sp. YR583]